MSDMTTQGTQNDDPPVIQSELEAAASLTPSTPSASQPFYFYQDEEDGVAPDHDVSAPFAIPFQLSSAQPVIEPDQEPRSGSITPPVSPSRARPRQVRVRWSLVLKLVSVALVVSVIFGILWFAILAPSSQSLTTTTPVIHHPVTSTVPKATKPTPAPARTTPPQRGATRPPQNGSWIPPQLPAGWTAAQLTTGDALFAERTAWTFTDREEALDFRDVGTRGQHGGTFTAATFLLTAAGLMRFNQNDVRVINNVLFDQVQQVQLIQSAVNALPQLIQFQAQGQNQFALVDVAYQLYQSQVNPTTEKRTEGVQIDAVAKQPVVHHMRVWLLRVTPGMQGTAAPMGGSGWLVSTYGLDLSSPLVITQPA